MPLISLTRIPFWPKLSVEEHVSTLHSKREGSVIWGRKRREKGGYRWPSLPRRAVYGHSSLECTNKPIALLQLQQNL